MVDRSTLVEGADAALTAFKSAELAPGVSMSEPKSEDEKPKIVGPATSVPAQVEPLAFEVGYKVQSETLADSPARSTDSPEDVRHLLA